MKREKIDERLEMAFLVAVAVVAAAVVALIAVTLWLR